MTAEPVFQEAWQAQAFAMATLLQQQGYVTPRERAEALGREIAAARDRGDVDDGAKRTITMTGSPRWRRRSHRRA